MYTYGRRASGRGIRYLIAALLCLPLLLWAGLRTFSAVRFDIAVGGHLKRAADANTVELAEQELSTALDAAADRGLTSGYTSVLFRTPDEDVGFWYRNLTASRAELEKVGPQTTQLERSNLLLKLRETLLDKGQSGERVTVPPGISVFPDNEAWFWWGMFSAALLCVSVALAWKTLFSSY